MKTITDLKSTVSSDIYHRVAEIIISGLQGVTTTQRSFEAGKINMVIDPNQINHRMRYITETVAGLAVDGVLAKLNEVQH